LLKNSFKWPRPTTHCTHVSKVRNWLLTSMATWDPCNSHQIGVPRPVASGNGVNQSKGGNVLWNLIVVAALVLLALWVLGLVLSWGGLIHILLVVALVLIVVRLLQGRKLA
jgi:hypothetical protein